MKIVYTMDFLYHAFTNLNTYHYWSVELINPIIKMVTNQPIIELKNLQNADNEVFSREKFYSLSEINQVADAYYNYDVSLLKKESIDYLKSFLNENTLVIGSELGIELKKILTDLNIPFINLWFHSWKLFDDSFFMVNTNNKTIFDVLQKYKVDRLQFDFYANYWKIWSEQKKHIKDENLVENSVVFIGQTLRDKSTDKNGKYLNILDFKTELQNLMLTYNHIYYIPHPYVDYNQEIEDYINQTPYITKLTTIPTYNVLMSRKITKVISISSSVLYEAQFFGKEIEYLYKPLFNIDGTFEDDTFTSIYNDYFNPTFWKEILEHFMPININVPNKNLFFNNDNKFRDIKGLYYGYAHFDKHKINETKINECMHKINNVENCVKKEKIKKRNILQLRFKKNFYKAIFLLSHLKQYEYKYKKTKAQLKSLPFPNYRDFINKELFDNIKDNEISVLINGIYDEVQTPECIDSVRRFLPNCQIILSTWENQRISDDVKKLCNKIIYNKDPGFEYSDPEHKVPNNISRILCSIQNGLPYCEKKYVLRMRSDLVLTGTNFLEYFQLFPKYDKKYKLFKSKVIINSFCTTDNIKQNDYTLFTPFHISDWYHFGLKEDIKELFKLPKVGNLTKYSRYFEKHKRKLNYNMDAIQKRLWKFSVEQYIGLHNAKKIFKTIPIKDFLCFSAKDLNNSNLFILNNFIVLDAEHSNIYALKERYKELNYSFNENIHPYLKDGIWSFSKYCSNYIKHFYNNGINIHSDEISVVMQGALSKEFTKRGLLSIRAYLSNAEIILSTWEGSDVSSLEGLYDKLILNKDPGGVVFNAKGNEQNQNRQILSTKNGIKTSSKKYVLKIRTDMCLLGIKFLSYFDKYPARNVEYSILKKRILINSLYTRLANKIPSNTKPFLFHISDWMMFGLREDLVNVWDIPLAPEPETSQYFLMHPEIPHYDGCFTRYHAEQYIWLKFLEKNGYKIDYEHWKCYSDKLKEISNLSLINNTILLNYLDTFDILCQKYPYKYGDSPTMHENDWLFLYVIYCDISAILLLILRYISDFQFHSLFQALKLMKQKIIRLKLFSNKENYLILFGKKIF